MKLTINTKKIEALAPCRDRFDIWKKYYGKKSFDILEFLELDKITTRDKIWVSVRVLPRELIEVFAIDCVFSAYAAVYVSYVADAVDAADAADVAATAAADAAAADDADEERENQVDALIMLAKDWKLR